MDCDRHLGSEKVEVDKSVWPHGQKVDRSQFTICMRPAVDDPAASCPAAKSLAASRGVQLSTHRMWWHRKVPTERRACLVSSGTRMSVTASPKLYVSTYIHTTYLIESAHFSSPEPELYRRYLRRVQFSAIIARRCVDEPHAGHSIKLLPRNPCRWRVWLGPGSLQEI